jgi:flagellar hook-basal body complex protein FliE
MNGIDSTRLLLEMRSLALEAARKPPGANPLAAGNAAGSPGDFAQALRSAAERVNDLQVNARTLSTAFEAGQAGVDITQVMIEIQKAGIAFKAMTEVRNKLVNAYQEVMNMPI